MIKIAFFDTKDYDREFFEKYNKEYGFKITYIESRLNQDTAMLAKGYDAVCVFVNDMVDKNTIQILKDLGVKLIALRCAGFNNVDLSCVEGDIKVVRVPAYSPYAVAEHAAALLLCLNRKIHESFNRTQKYNFTLNGLLGFDIHGKTVGVIGTGRIGKSFINIMKGFGANVIAYDVYKDEKFAMENDVKYVTLNELYSSSDIISLHCPLTSENEYMINKNSFEKMKNGVVIINTSRGKLVKTDDLIECLKSGKIAGLGLDVYENEAEFFLNDMSNLYIRDEKLSTLLSMPNVIVTSHQAFFTRDALDKIASTTCENIREIFEKGSSENEVK